MSSCALTASTTGRGFMPAALHHSPADASRMERPSEVLKYMPLPDDTTRGFVFKKPRLLEKGIHRLSSVASRFTREALALANDAAPRQHPRFFPRFAESLSAIC